MPEEIKDFATSPLSDEELQHLRRIIQADERARWLWASARTWATWITAVTLGAAATKTFWLDLISGGGKH